MNETVKIKEYSDYESYIKHQSEKMKVKFKQIYKIDKFNEETVYNRYKKLFDFTQKNVICLAARMGGEVKAFKNLNALAIGIDIEPGEKNEHVLYGDFHNINFPSGLFDFVFCNSIDHVLFLDKFFVEAKRILKPSGIFLLEIAIQAAGQYEVIDTKNIDFLKKEILKYFLVDNEISIVNKWEGVLLILKNR